jgi:hypothetical protein
MKTLDVQAWACGAGTQSGAIAALIGDGALPRPDLCYMTDTGRERSSTWPFVEKFIKPQLARVSCELNIVPASQFANVQLISAGTILLPGYTTQNGAVGKLSAFCSGKWKRDVAERYMRSLGIETATNWMGISTDEVRRVRTPHRGWLKLWYPLIFSVRMSRLDCVQFIRTKGWLGEIPHSACKICPNLSDDEWQEMKQYQPEDFAEACQTGRDLQAIDPHFWLHSSCQPLENVDFTAQHSMFADRGCTGGCFT